MQRYVLILPNGRLLDRERCFILRSDRFAMFRSFLFHPVLYAFYFHLAFLTSTLIFVSYNTVLYSTVYANNYPLPLKHFSLHTAIIYRRYSSLFRRTFFYRTKFSFEGTPQNDLAERSITFDRSVDFMVLLIQGRTLANQRRGSQRSA